MILRNVDSKVKEIKRDFDIKNRPLVREFLYRVFADCGVGSNSDMIDEYITPKKLNPKKIRLNTLYSIEMCIVLIYIFILILTLLIIPQ